LAKVLVIIIIIELKPSITTTLDPLHGNVTATIHFSLQFGVLRAYLTYRFGGGDTVALPSIIKSFPLFMEVVDIFNGTLKNSAFVLVAIGN
jgi:hypothetical protein